MHQPDQRLNINDLGLLRMNGHRFVVNRRVGVPSNALIEKAGNFLRCWASHIPLTDAAAEYVRRNAEYHEQPNYFVWKENVSVPEINR